MKHRILVINPGSTSTKIAVFEGKEKLFDTTLRYSNARAIGALAAAADGKIDCIILTGGLAHSKYVAAYITKKVSFIAPVEVMAGELELEALAAGACRVLDGEEKAKDFSKLLEKA